MSTLIEASRKHVRPEQIATQTRTSVLQDIGNDLREKFGNGYLASLAVREINKKRGDPVNKPMPRRHYTILDSVKHPEEVLALREIYGDALWVIGVFAPASIRKGRLKSKGMQERDLVTVFERDESEGLLHGQNVRTTMEMADFFVRNDGSNASKVQRAIQRFLEIIFATSLRTPSQDELAMHAAKSAASASACLSRQVGAVVVSEEGEIIGTGANDVPKFGGGLYSEHDGDEDHRCWKWKAGICHNDRRKRELLESIVTDLKSAGALKPSPPSDPREVARKAGIKDLIEFSRSVHAEMEAIISVARSGKVGLVGASIYSTTFPCHSCARHIVASGIHRVVYVEPYPKSLAIELHEDAVSTDEKDKGKKVVFLQYEGVAPRSFLRLFSDRGDRKESGRYVHKPKRSASPVSQVPLDGFVDREKMVVVELGKRESAPTLGGLNG